MHRRALLLSIALGACARSPARVVAEARPDPITMVRTLVADGRFEDLEPLVALVGSARVVALGEASHLDGSAFDAKVRLIEFLHQRLGFDVVAWESSVWACEQMETALDRPGDEDVRPIGMGWPWVAAKQVAPLFAYARSTRKSAHPLHMAGVDPQFGGEGTIPRFRAWILALAERISAPTIDVKDAFEKFPKERSFREMTAESRGRDRASFAALRAHVAQSTDVDRSLALRALDAVDALYRWHEDVGAEVSTKIPWDDRVALNNVRDAAMADGLKWLLEERYPGHRIILWSASTHVARSTAAIAEGEHDIFAGHHPMGEILSKMLGRDYFVLAATAFSGSIGNMPRAPVRVLESPPPGSLEAIIGPRFPIAAIVDLHRATVPGVARLIGNQPMTADWPAVFDAALVIHTMTPAL